MVGEGEMEERKETHSPTLGPAAALKRSLDPWSISKRQPHRKHPLFTTDPTTLIPSRHDITMPIPRPVALTRVANKIAANSSPLAISQRTFVRGFSQSNQRQAADHAHEDHYDPPSGWLFGVKPGEKPEKEGWENVWIWGFFGSLGLGVVAYAFKPDTSIQTWALEEARRRLEVEGILKEPESKS